MIQWNNNVTLRAYGFNGNPAKVIYDKQFKDKGFGVESKGDRWNQIDFYKNKGNKSERLEISFNNPVTDITLFTGNLGKNEGKKGFDETGKWVAYDASGNKIATGLIGPDYSKLGKDKKVPNSYGNYPFAVNASKAIKKLVITATGFGDGKQKPHNRKYGENNSDFNITEISYRTE